MTYMEDEFMPEPLKRIPNWLKEWLGCCVALAAVLLICTEFGQYDHIGHDAFFLTAMTGIYLVCCLVSLRYFRQPR